MEYNYREETVIYDDTVYSLSDSEGKAISNGASISDYIALSNQDNIVLTLTDLTSNETKAEYVPKREILGQILIDYNYEETLQSVSEAIEYAYNPEMENAKIGENDYVPLPIGTTLYLRRMATDRKFASTITGAHAPQQRRAAPELSIQNVTPLSIEFTDIDGATLYIEGMGLANSNLIKNLEPDTTYKIYAFYPATNSEYASDIFEIDVTTLKGTNIKVVYSMSNRDMFSDVVGVVEGENTVTPGRILADYGFVLAESENNTQTVNVTYSNGAYTSDKDTLYFEVVPNRDISDLYCEFYFYDTNGDKIAFNKQSFNGQVYISEDDVILPEGYRMVKENEEENNDISVLYYSSDHVWFALPNTCDIVVEKIKTVTLYGDVNEDAKIDAADAILILQFYSNIITDENSYNLPNADVNGDGYITALDAILVLQKYSDIISAFPVEV